MVTILILVDGFLQFILSYSQGLDIDCHNPYFSRWFSAILFKNALNKRNIRHNPYFSRWFSAIQKLADANFTEFKVTILILVDGFLQY